MAVFTSAPVRVESPAEAVAEKFSDLSRLQQVIDNIPADERAKIGDIALTPDSIVMKTQQVGEITLKVTERTPSRVALTAVGAPVPMNLSVDIRPDGADRCEVSTSMDVAIPPFLKAMVGGTMQKAVDQFGALMAKLV